MAGDYHRDFLELLGERRGRGAAAVVPAAATPDRVVAALPERAA
jgi:hypothetical protein